MQKQLDDHGRRLLVLEQALSNIIKEETDG
jgi:hypothetical protein